MRIVTYGAACSLDGFITGPGAALDWLHHSPDVAAIMKDYWSRTDTLLFGRKTWDTAQGMGGGPSTAGIRSVLFSRTLTNSPQADVDLVSRDAGDYVRALKAKKGKDILVMSGGNLASSLLAEDVIDEIGLNVHPVLLGSGTPLFVDPGRRVDLELKECRALHGGCVLMTYRVRRGRSARK